MSYKLPNPQISFRLNPDEYELLNALSENYQEENQKDFTNAKQFVMAMLSNINELENKISDFESTLKTIENTPKTTVNNEMLELEPLFIKAKDIIGYSSLDDLGSTSAPSNIDILADLIEMISQPLEPAPTVEIEKEVIKEVPISLTENEVIVKMTPQQKSSLDYIGNYRFKNHLDKEQMDTASIIRRLTFQRSSLVNWLGEFETGIKK